MKFLSKNILTGLIVEALSLFILSPSINAGSTACEKQI